MASTVQITDPDAAPASGRAVSYDPVFAEYTLTERPGIVGGNPLAFCPWCGTALPSSQRDRWFEKLTDLGHAPDDLDLPDAFRTSQWRDGPGGHI